ncbi:hypothetical protein RUMHYD_03379 [Blautia hydrogenotrophica DSM 10507]|uniref:Uncharacterized protein n=1 Tax=Blautia hydrogenotrophica (strain DSM 10507 / JCM 14656 / S5a33) TaxID=476272 RepID=C0CR66_BLAHS|nr:hypothetical protein RUMHYD_03379 [Blautia hydrogenotrophica DSM 10507]
MRTKEKAQICKRTNYVEGGNYEKQIIQKNRQHSIMCDNGCGAACRVRQCTD